MPEYTYRIEPAAATDYPELTSVWEASVRATHDFLTDSDIAYFKPLVQREFLPVVEVYCIRAGNGAIAGFAGILNGKAEMLFVGPEHRGKGIGKALLRYVVEEKNVYAVDVNEQNPGAVGFYIHEGFKVKSRSPLDNMGKPFPILHMERR